MFQVITMWNLSRPDQDMREFVNNISLRGYSAKSYLTGEFARRIKDGDVKPLSVSNIADRWCLTKRDLYILKGRNKPAGIKPLKKWGKPVGTIVENYVWDVFSSKQASRSPHYLKIRESGKRVNQKFKEANGDRLEKLKLLEGPAGQVGEGDSEWLMHLLNAQGRAELAQYLLHKTLDEEGSMAPKDIENGVDATLRPNKTEIGINAPSTPDFIIPKYQVVGDVKTGLRFHDNYLLTCAGYALAYENTNAVVKRNIDWGIIYFFPTRTPVSYVKPLTFPQIYIFPIDDLLRGWFIEQRNESYKMISRDRIPDFPVTNTRCSECSYSHYCKSEGMIVS